MRSIIWRLKRYAHTCTFRSEVWEASIITGVPLLIKCKCVCGAERITSAGLQQREDKEITGCATHEEYCTKHNLTVEGVDDGRRSDQRPG